MQPDTSWVERAQTAFREKFGPPLKALHEPLDDWLGQLSMSTAVACAVGLYLLALVWVWTLNRRFIFRGAPDRRSWRDLRLWATVVLSPYLAIYFWLGR